MKKVVVIGGGFVGQLVQLAVPSAIVLDWRKTAPANHMDTRVGPQYLWEPIPGVPSTSFEVTTTVDGLSPTPESILAYKKKIGKEDDGGDWGLQFQHKMTGWHSELPVPRVDYGKTVWMIDINDKMLGMQDGPNICYDVLVSTIPLTALLKMLIVGPEYDRHGFRADTIYMAEYGGEAHVEGMRLNYLSDPSYAPYRETYVGTSRFFESLSPIEGGINHCLRPGKIHPHKESETLLETLKGYGLYCFGRFATWRPDELAHQTWQHIAEWREGLV